MAIDFDTLMAENETQLGAISREAVALHGRLAEMEAEVHRLEGERRLLVRLRDAEKNGGKEALGTAEITNDPTAPPPPALDETK